MSAQNWIGAAILGVLVACGGGAGGDAAEVATGAASATGSKWSGLYSSESTQFIYALSVKSEEPFVFSLSAARPNVRGVSVHAADLTGRFDDASKRSVTFTRGDCTLELKQTDGGIDLSQRGACTSLDVPSDLPLTASLNAAKDACWDESELSFKVSGTCKSSPGFEAGSAAPSKKEWEGLYGMETAHSIFALNVKSQAPFVFAISAGRSDGDGPAVNASDLAGQLDATAKKVTFHRGDCTLQLTKTELGIDVAQQGACTTLGVPSTFTLEASLDPMTDVCWDSSVRSFKVPGTCQPSAGF